MGPNHCINSERETIAVGALAYFIIQRASANATVVSRQVMHTFADQMNKNMKYEPDIEAEITFLSTEKGGKTRPVLSGYRPNHLIKQDYLTSGEHTYIDVQEVLPGQTAKAYIKFITPEAYPHTLWVGKIINVQEASHIVGFAKVLKIYNKLLETSSEQQH